MITMNFEPGKNRIIEEIFGSINAERRSQQALDKLIIAISAGALGITFTLFPNIRDFSFISKFLLVLIWLAYASTLILVLLGYEYAKKGWNKRQEYLVKLYKKEISYEKFQNFEEKENKNMITAISINKWTLRTFISGAIIFFLFGITVLYKIRLF